MLGDQDIIDGKRGKTILYFCLRLKDSSVPIVTLVIPQVYLHTESDSSRRSLFMSSHFSERRVSYCVSVYVYVPLNILNRILGSTYGKRGFGRCL